MWTWIGYIDFLSSSVKRCFSSISVLLQLLRRVSWTTVSGELENITPVFASGFCLWYLALKSTNFGHEPTLIRFWKLDHAKSENEGRDGAWVVWNHIWWSINTFPLRKRKTNWFYSQIFKLKVICVHLVTVLQWSFVLHELDFLVDTYRETLYQNLFPDPLAPHVYLFCIQWL